MSDWADVYRSDVELVVAALRHYAGCVADSGDESAVRVRARCRALADLLAQPAPAPPPVVGD